MADSKQLSKENPATDKVQEICDQVKCQAKGKPGGQCYEMFRAISYKTLETQKPCGTLYFIKVIVDRDECVHLRVREIPTYCQCDHTGEKLKLEDIRTAKSLKDPIEFF